MQRSPLSRLTFAIALAISLPCASHATKRDFAAPPERILDKTAYTLTHGQVRLDAGLVGVGTQDLGVKLGAAVGIADRFQFSFNLAHAGIGMLNLATKINLFDRRWWGLGLRIEGRWLRGDWLWIVNESTRETLSGIEFLSIPLAVVASFPVLRWLGLHLQFGYIHAEVFGDLKSNEAALEGTAGVREIFLEPAVHIYLWDRVALVVGAHLPLFARAAVRASVEDLVEPDLIVGVQAAGWEDVPFDAIDGYYGGIELRFGKYTFLQVYATHGAINEVIRSPVLPSLNFYWRF